MSTVCGAALAVATVYYVWRAAVQAGARRLRRQRERVAYMLWVMAEQEGEPADRWRRTPPPRHPFRLMTAVGENRRRG
jgi:hypothetical protein